MNCKFCNAPLDWGQTTCPECGRENPRPPKKKGSKVLWIACAVLVVAVAALAAVVVLRNQKADGDPSMIFTGAYAAYTVPEKNYTVAAEQMDEALGSTVVGKCGTAELDNVTLSYYYWHTFYAYSGYLAGYVDSSKGLEEQKYGEVTWQQMLLNMALMNWEQTEAMSQEAVKAGRFDEQAQKDVELTMQGIQETVDQSDQFETVEEYLQYYYGPQASEESYRAYALASRLADLYYQDVGSSISYTDEDIDNYFNANLSTYLNNGIEKSDVSNIDVRHILIEPEDKDDDASWDEAEVKAQQLYDQWKSGEKTEDSFAALVAANSADGGSAANGGLYTEVAPGDMVEAFNDWCFDESRQPGDSGIVETEFGYHIMYFVRQTGTQRWYEAAKSDYVSEKQSAALMEVVDSVEYELDFNKMALISSPLYTG